jgi:hypothetical protein
MLQELWRAEPHPPATEHDLAAIRAAILDYFEGWFDGDAARMGRALHPALAKRSYGQDADRAPALSSITADEMVGWTEKGSGRARAGDDRMIDIRIDDVSGGIASAQVRSEHYIEYIHLVATVDGWKILNTIWRWNDGHGPRA